MIKIMFVCYGNICRSPMAEFLMKEFVKKKGKQGDFLIKSSATSYEEIGNPVYYGTAKILDRLNIDYSKKRSEKLLKTDYEKYDYFVGMDEDNRYQMERLFDGDKENKVCCILDFSSNKRDVADPWYTRNFEETYFDIKEGIETFYNHLEKTNKI